MDTARSCDNAHWREAAEGLHGEEPIGDVPKRACHTRLFDNDSTLTHHHRMCDAPTLRTCTYCGQQYAPRHVKHVLACHREECKRKRRQERDCKRYTKWYAENLTYHSVACQLRYKRIATPENIARICPLKGRGFVDASEVQALAGDLLAKPDARNVCKSLPRIVTPEPIATRDAWSIASPTREYLPGRLVEIRAHPRPLLTEWAPSVLRQLHAIITKVTSIPHDPRMPNFTLVQHRRYPSVYAWMRYESHVALLPEVANMELYGQPTRITFPLKWSVKAPKPYDPGQYKRRIKTVTPFGIYQGITRALKTDLTDIVTQLHNTATQIGMDDHDEIVARVTSQDTEMVSMRVGGHVTRSDAGVGYADALHGVVDVECNAIGAWLLDVAAITGFGAKTAFGFGRIRVEAL